MEEKVDGDYAVFWVKVSSIPASPNKTTIYIYYGKPDATSASDGSSTFEFFDDFEGSSLNTSKWYISSTNYSVSNSILRINSGGIGLQNPLSFKLQDGYMVETRICFVALSSGYSGTIPELSSSRFTQSGNANADATVLYMRQNSSSQVWYWIGDGSAATYNVGIGYAGWTSSAGHWYTTGVSVNGGTLKLWKDYTAVKTFPAITWHKDLKYISLGAFHGRPAYDIQDTSYDWVRIRKYVEPEPSHGSWGEEEELPS